MTTIISLSYRSIRAFTLVELMIVIAIIGILAAALFPSLTGYLARSRDTVRITDINRLGSTLRIYDADNGHMPSTTLYSGADQGGWDFSSQPAGSPTFVKSTIFPVSLLRGAL